MAPNSAKRNGFFKLQAVCNPTLSKLNRKNMKLGKLLLLATILTGAFRLSAADQISRIEPPNWWTGMKNPKLQLLVHGNRINNLDPRIDYPGVTIDRVIKVENANYLFIDLVIAPATKPGTLRIDFLANGSIAESHNYALLEREPGSAERKGFDNADVMYLITPDRFANGDPANDEVAGMREKPNRANIGGRHGGDIEGIRKNLDYISKMGFTAIWLNPVLENDMQAYSYHGYSTTDFYKVDPRFGTNESYRQLSREAKTRGIKMIMDMIVNHCGTEHWWMKDLPMEDWINNARTYVETNHKKTLLQDPHGSEADKRIFTDGWFVPTMPDMNQRNDLMAVYLTQNSIWWVEYAGLDGIRMDTYPYPDMDYMSEWTKALMAEYPNFNIVGEEWHENPAIVAYWQRGKINPNGYKSYLKSLMDFPMQSALSQSLNMPEQYGESWSKLYETLSFDFLYPAPNDLVVFPDNHDMSRIFTQVNEDYDLFRMAVAYILTTRGVPQLYYGTEVLMKNPGTGDHGVIRSDFPGGWSGDAVNGFTGSGLTDRQKAAQAYVQKLLQWRKNATAVHFGKLVHFVPKGNVYVYFRFDSRQKVMVLLNKNREAATVDPARFAEILSGATSATDIITGKTIRIDATFQIPARSPMILQIE